MLALPPIDTAAKIFDSSGQRPAGGNVASTYTDHGIPKTTLVPPIRIATACVEGRSQNLRSNHGALRTDIAADNRCQ